MKSVRAMISGRVQGVCYRAWTQGEATKLGLSGWVRNRRDGTVEALFFGPDGDVDAMVERCRRGPTQAHVTSIEVTPGDAPETDGFHMLSTR